MFGDFYIFIQVCVEIYPREGTETPSYPRALFVSVRAVEIYPREGTETKIFISCSSMFIVEIYPREGTETTRSHVKRPFCPVEIYPREGTETLPAVLAGQSPLLKFIPARGLKRVT